MRWLAKQRELGKTSLQG